MANAKKSRTTPKKEKLVTPVDITSAKDWKKKTGVTNLSIPSGNVAQVRNPGLQHFLSQGIIPNALMPIVQKALEGEKPEETEVAALVTSTEGIQDMLEFVDKVTLACVLQPVVSPAPPAGVERDSVVLYVDDVDLEDKLFIFQWVMGGTRDLEPFREAIAEGLELVPSSTDVVD